ncbi:MAG TPA: patatin-like phospholipase family protein, partial [Candidatus Nitrosotenuis sp.]|nr:patatin-like phospholipase family protein [Candidatus Nitrosotenuis sp.]
MAVATGSAQEPASHDESALSFGQVFEIELKELCELRHRRAKAAGDDSAQKPTQEEVGKSLIGLSFSGGGIRSATFNLGILQALAQLNLLSRIDYLSTVSGGGYIGSWLSAWVKRFGLKTVVRELQPLA